MANGKNTKGEGTKKSSAGTVPAAKKTAAGRTSPGTRAAATKTAAGIKSPAATPASNASSQGTVPSAEALRIEKRPDGVAVLWMDVPGESVNTLKSSFAADFERAFTSVETDAAVVAIVLASAKKDSFIAGADIGMLKAVKSADDGEAVSKNGQDAMDRIERLSKPVVAAIHGACLGGGLETALACHARVASDHPKTKLGLPEVQLGLLPGAGGTQRLPKLIGVPNALDLLLTGKQLVARKAKSLGLVDDVVAPAILIQVAAELALSLVGKIHHQTTTREHLRHLFDPSGEGLREFALEDNPLGRKILFDQAKKQLLSKSRGNYPAPERILEVVRAGLDYGTARGLSEERRAFGELLMGNVSKELINIFFATQALKKDTGVASKNVQPAKITKVAVLGAGLMGAGVAYVTADNAKTPVRIKDKDAEGLLRGMAAVHAIIDEKVKKKRTSRHEGDRLQSTITGTTDYSGFDRVSVVIEAVFEDIAIKHKVLREVESHTGKNTIFASNTSSLPIAKIAAASKHPETVIGMHYFSPVNKMPLLEIIVTPRTADWVTATCVELGKKQGKTVIVVNDGVGFYTTRILAPLMNEAAYLIAEGVSIPDIDQAMIDYGYPVGPIKLTDEVGIDVGAKIGHILVEAFGERLSPPDGMDRLIADQRFGKKNKRGFYRYDDESKKREVDESVYTVLGVKPGTKMDATEIAERCTLQMVNEAARCLEENILRSPRDGDIGAIFGLGFPPFRGGPFRFVDSLGAATVVDKLRAFEAKHGARFTPAKILVEMAASGGKFYGERTPGTAATKSPRTTDTTARA